MYNIWLNIKHVYMQIKATTYIYIYNGIIPMLIGADHDAVQTGFKPLDLCEISILID